MVLKVQVHIVTEYFPLWHAGAVGTADQAEELDWFALRPAVLTLAGRAASDFWRDGEKHLKSALAIQPAATELAYILVQVPGSARTILPDTPRNGRTSKSAAGGELVALVMLMNWQSALVAAPAATA